MPDIDPETGKPNYLKGQPTAKKEALAVAYIKCRNWMEAYRTTYDVENMSERSQDAAVTRLKNDPFVKRRIAEMQAKISDRAVMSISKLVDMFLEDRDLAHEMGQAAAAAQCTMHIGKMLGIYLDKRVIGTPDEFENMSKLELQQYVMEKTKLLLGGQQPLLIEHEAAAEEDDAD